MDKHLTNEHGKSNRMFSSKLNAKMTDIICAICVEELFTKEKPVNGIPCGHMFHQECLDTWINIR